LETSEIGGFSQKIDSLISKNGKISKSESPKKITLAYPIHKKSQAFLATFEFSAPAENIESLKKEFKKEKQILRFLLIKKKGVEEIKERLKPIPVKAPVGKKEKLMPEKKVGLKEIEEKLEKILEE